MTQANLIEGNFYHISHVLVGCFVATFERVSKDQAHEGEARIYTFISHMNGEEYLINALLIDQYFITPYIYN